eukprot:gnl/TRDRNA2_/TRDRNA2_45276_c0_seq1.p1 gnl/TRDRNA2_/TRDRNA2_45276_c0~~gnl/TRDRNA2_/TRDRNA2_45276_c0_seq1.p1  ORF type:complete len:644 (+),score=99.36 gnl/TRDRNA2_/TRDRNA2_45276_c0_seq1:52-1983(+)
MGNAGASAALEHDISEKEQLNALNGDVTVKSFAARLASAEHASVTVICGAGISVSAGIPDFRSPGSGLYENLQKYNLPTPESIFTLDYFRENPLPFFQLAKEMYPGRFAPTPAHAFLKLLQDKGLLRRCFTQNIDTLERLAGINPKLLVEAHGSFGQAHCLDCRAVHDSDWVREEIFADRIPIRCTKCNGLVKPDIVFFGEPLPKRFSMMRQADLPEAELLIVMGTSLSVDPFASIVNEVRATCPRLLINRERVGVRQGRGPGFRLDAYDNYRDVAILGSCDGGVRAVADAAGWSVELEAVVKALQEASPQACNGVNASENGGGDLSPSATSYCWRRRLASELPSLEQAIERDDDGSPVARSIDPFEGTSTARIVLRIPETAFSPKNQQAIVRQAETTPALSEESREAQQTETSDTVLQPETSGTVPQPHASDSVQTSCAEEAADSETVSVQEVARPGANAFTVSGGETLVFDVHFFEDWYWAEGSSRTTWLGLLPRGSLVPSSVVESTKTSIDEAEARSTGRVELSITVPPLTKRQLKNCEAPVYEAWLVQEYFDSAGNPEGFVAARAGPLTVALRNADGVAVANRFALLYAKSALHVDNGDGRVDADNVAEAGVGEQGCGDATGDAAAPEARTEGTPTSAA